MLQNKTGKRSSRVASDLPPLAHPPRPASVSTCSTQSQTASWTALVAEVVAPERTRATALQGEVKQLKASLKELRDRGCSDQDDAREEQARQAREAEELWATQKAELLAQLAAQQVVASEHEAERGRWQELEKQLRAQAENGVEVGQRCHEDLQAMRQQLTCSQIDAKDLQKQIATLKTENDAVLQERDLLLQRLEEQQAETDARVDALEQRFMETLHAKTSGK